MGSNDAYQLLNGCATAGLLGLLGQGLRAAAGLRQEMSNGAAGSGALTFVFDKPRFWFSLFTGTCAGMAAYLGMRYGGDADSINWNSGKFVLGLVAAGYAGADFIESFAKKYLPK